MTNIEDKDRSEGDVRPRGSDDPDRRELVRKLGKFAVYAAPFTVLAATGKAAKGRGHASGGGPHH